MELLFLGTGTSVGVPMIGCDCAVCRSSDPRNRRRRTSLYLRAGETAILVDTPPEFREQALDHDLRRVDFVLFTHAHADHIFGLDDIRRFNTLQGGAIPAYAAPETLEYLLRVFAYCGRESTEGMYRPRILFRPVNGPFRVNDVLVTPVDVEHGEDRTLGYRFDWKGRSLGYVPDCASMDDAAVASFQGVQVMVLDGLRHRPHRTHLTIAASLTLLERIGAERSLLVHMCHDIDHGAEQARLPPGVEFSWDGLRLKV